MGGPRAILDRKLENQKKLKSLIIGLKKKKMDGGWGELYPNLRMSGIFLSLQGP